MANGIVLLAGLIFAMFIAAAFMDTVLGQPRGSSGQFQTMRTTKVKNLLALSLLLFLIVYVVINT